MDKQILQVKISKNNEGSIQQASAFFASLSGYTSNLWQRITGRQKTLAFEIVLDSQLISFYVIVEPAIVSFITAQLGAQYPSAVISKSKEYLSAWYWEQASVGKLILKEPYYYPLKTYRDFKNLDPLSSLLGTLAKAGPEDKALIQMMIVPADSSYSRSARRILDRGLPSPGQPGSSRSHPQASLIQAKIQQKAFKTSIKLCAISTDKPAGKSFLEHLAGSFGALTTGEGNSLVLKKQKLSKKKFITHLINRQFKQVPRYQYLNIEELATLWHLPGEELSGIKNIAWGGQLLSEPPSNLPVAEGAEESEKNDINFFARTEFKNQEVNFGIKKVDRRRHIYSIGKTGTGKSTLIANMVIDDMRKGRGLAVIDPHGELCETILDYIPSHRLNDFCYLNPSDTKFPFRLNPLEVKAKEHSELVVSGIVAIFHKLYGYSWGPRLEYFLRNALMTLITRPGSTLVDVPRILTDDQFRKKVVDKYADSVLKSFWHNEYEQMSPKFRAEAISSILNKVGQFVTSPMIREIIGYPQSTINLQEFMDEGKILLCNFSQGQMGEDNAALLGALLITKMQLAAMNRVNTPEEERRDFYLYVDEFQNFATESFTKILSEARKYRLNIMVANQYMGQLDDKVQKALFGNVGTLISFLVGAQDASILSREFGKNYEPDDLVGLGNYQTVIKLAIDNLTSTPFYAKTLPLPDCRNKNREKALQLSRERYTRQGK